VKLVREHCRFGPYALVARKGGAWLGFHPDAPLLLVHLDIAPKPSVGTMFIEAEEWLREHARKPMPDFFESGAVGQDVYLAHRELGGISLLDVAAAIRDRGMEPAAPTALAMASQMAGLFGMLPPGPNGQALIEERRVWFRWDGKAWLDLPTPFELSRAGASAPLTSFAQMPPEQLGGAPLDARGNVYRFATLLVRAWTGRTVVESAADHEVIQRVKSGAIDPITLPDHFPLPLSDLLIWCLATDPAMRPESVGEVKKILDDLGTEFDTGPHAIAGYLQAVFQEEAGAASQLGDDLAALTPEQIAAWPTLEQLIESQSHVGTGGRKRVPSWWNKILRR
jgi:hypothetical protein